MKHITWKKYRNISITSVCVVIFLMNMHDIILITLQLNLFFYSVRRRGRNIPYPSYVISLLIFCLIFLFLVFHCNSSFMICFHTIYWISLFFFIYLLLLFYYFFCFSISKFINLELKRKFLLRVCTFLGVLCVNLRVYVYVYVCM